VDSGELRCEGTVINRGRTTALAEARIFDARDRLVAHATSSCILFEVSHGG
jgi:acyl-coenzyme A thioesterase PaaI-like protein